MTLLLRQDSNIRIGLLQTNLSVLQRDPRLTQRLREFANGIVYSHVIQLGDVIIGCLDAIAKVLFLQLVVADRTINRMVFILQAIEIILHQIGKQAVDALADINLSLLRV